MKPEDPFQTINQTLERLKLFEDSQELATALRLDQGNNEYWAEEAAIHIESLWEVANKMAHHLRCFMDSEK